MTTTNTTGTGRGGGQETRRRVQRAALDLFTRQGYDATSMREIADAVGVNKASLYYHFASKQAILQSLVDDRGSEAADLLTWLRVAPREPDLLGRTVLRWVDAWTVEKLAAIRFAAANPLVARSLDDAGGRSIGTPLTAVADELAALLPDPRPEDALLVRMALLSINAAVQAAASTTVDDEAVVAAARRSARAVLRELGDAR